MTHKYNPKLKTYSRSLRTQMTDAETLLWSRIRMKQLLDIQFYRQKPLGQFIVDFYAPAAKLIIEVDGGQHFEKKGMLLDQKRDAYLKTLGLEILRFDNLQVLQTIDSVLDVIFHTLEKRVGV